MDATPASNFGVSLPVSLLHQGTFLSVVYFSCWLWDQCGVQDDNKIPELVNGNVDLRKAVKIVKKSESRKTDRHSLLRALRNATAHGRIEVCDEYFVFTDRRPWDESDVIVLRVTWGNTAKIAEGVFWALQRKLLLRPKPPRRSSTRPLGRRHYLGLARGRAGILIDAERD
jgi:hypothetical protein